MRSQKGPPTVAGHDGESVKAIREDGVPGLHLKTETGDDIPGKVFPVYI